MGCWLSLWFAALVRAWFFLPPLETVGAAEISSSWPRGVRKVYPFCIKPMVVDQAVDAARSAPNEAPNLNRVSDIRLLWNLEFGEFGDRRDVSLFPQSIQWDGRNVRSGNIPFSSPSFRALGSLYAAKHGFDVDDGRSVNGFDGTNPQAFLFNLAHDDGMKT